MREQEPISTYIGCRYVPRTRSRRVRPRSAEPFKNMARSSRHPRNLGDTEHLTRRLAGVRIPIQASKGIEAHQAIESKSPE